MITTFNILCWRYENPKLKIPAVGQIILPKIELYKMKDSFNIGAEIEFDASYLAWNQNESNHYHACQPASVTTFDNFGYFDILISILISDLR